MQSLPENLINYCRFAHCVDEETVHQAAEFSGQPISADNELTVLQQLMGYLKGRLDRFDPPLNFLSAMAIRQSGHIKAFQME